MAKPINPETIVYGFTSAGDADVSPDGTRVLTMLPAARVAEGSTLHINVMLNFADELRRRLK